MPLKIKVCGLRSLEQIESLNAMGVDYCGLIFFRASPRFAGDAGLADALLQCPLHCKLTGVFANEQEEVIIQTIRDYGLKAVQLCGTESPGFCDSMRIHAEVLKVFHLHDNFDFDQLEEYEQCCDYFLFDTKSQLHGGSGKKFNWDLLQYVNGKTPFFLSGGISPDDLETISKIQHPSFVGIDINSRFEISPGIKNISVIQKFYDQIKQL